jgi:hypothetical protein
VKGGELRVEGEANTIVTGDFQGHPEGGYWNVLVEEDGKVVIEEGRKLTLGEEGGIWLRKGLLTTKVNSSVTNHLATIEGYLAVGEGSVVQIATEGRPTGAFVPTLHIEGDIEFLSGTYKPTVYADGGNIHDRWTCSGKMTAWSDAKIEPIVVGTPAPGLSWDVIIAMDGFDGEGRPTVATGWERDSGDGTAYGHPEYKSILVRKAPN